MERKPPSSLGEFIAVVKRRKYWIVIPAVIVIALCLALAPLIPRTYKSTTTVIVVPQKISTAYVQASANDVENRLHRIELAIVSGPDFVQLINRLNLYPELRGKNKMNQIAALMGQDISVDIPADELDQRGNVEGFTISYIAPTPHKAQQATKAIADLFVRENAREGHLQAAGTDAFLSAQVAQAGQQLAAEQAKIQAFKDAHLGSLPEQAQANMGLIAQFQAELQANSSAIDQANQQRVYLQSVLNVNPNGGPGEAAPPPATPLQIELAQKRAELHADLLKYTPQHPDVIRLEHDIAALKVEVRQAPKTAGTTSLAQLPQTTGPSQVDLLRGQLLALNTEIKARNARQSQIEQKLSQLQGSVSSVPAVQTEYSSLDSQYQEMQKNYNALLEKQQEAAMAAQLDQRNDTEQFMVLNPANYPSKPYRPDPILLYLGAVVGGFFVGFIFALVVELRDDTMHNSDEVAEYLKLPIIVALPKCPAIPEKGWKISTAKG